MKWFALLLCTQVSLPASALECSDPTLRKMVLDDLNSTTLVQSTDARIIDVADPLTISPDSGDGNFVCSYSIHASDGEIERMRFAFSRNSLGEILYEGVPGE